MTDLGLPRPGLPGPSIAARHGTGARGDRGGSTFVALIALLLSCVPAAFVLAASDSAGDALGRAALHLAVVAGPIAVGLYAVRHQRSERFGHLLMATGVIWSFAVLSESDDSVLYSTGRVIAWAIVPLVVYLMLAFPEGRLTVRRDKVLFRAIAALVALCYVGSALLVDEYPTPVPWSDCTTSCPPNAFQVVGSEPGFVEAVLEPLRESLGVLLLLGVTAQLAARIRTPSAVRSTTTAPVLAVGILTSAVLIAFILVRRADPDGGAAETLGLIWALCLPGIAAAFALGLLQRRLFIGNVLSGLSLALRSSPGPLGIAAALRSSIGDPAVDVLIRDRRTGRWEHVDGRSSAEPVVEAGEGHAFREIGDGSETVAALVVDQDLDANDELLDAIVSLTESALRQSALKSELELSLTDLDRSRKRIATAADHERRRIERNLHDGAQQRLIALRMRLSLAEDLLATDPVAAASAVHNLGDDVDRALDEIRALAHGIYPALLADRGLVDALRGAARHASLPVKVSGEKLGRYPPEIESAVYFTCLEALQNVAKHANATGVRITLHHNAVLEFEVADDGDGFDTRAVSAGSGMRNMRDRVESLQGTFAVISSPGRGTLVRGRVPVAAPV